MPVKWVLLGDDGIVPGTAAARDARRLRKEFPSFENDLRREVELLRECACLPPDDPIPGTERRAFKRRVKRSDSNEGKRGGYRFVYGVFPEGIAFLRFYYKRQEQKVDLRELLKALSEVEASMQVDSTEPS